MYFIFLLHKNFFKSTDGFIKTMILKLLYEINNYFTPRIALVYISKLFNF